MARRSSGFSVAYGCMCGSEFRTIAQLDIHMSGCVVAHQPIPERDAMDILRENEENGVEVDPNSPIMDVGDFSD